MSSAKTVQIELDRARNWRFTTGARIRLCDRLNVPDGLQEVLNTIGNPDEDESERMTRLKGKDAHLKLIALIWCGQIPTDSPISFEEILEILDDEMIGKALPSMMEAITASMGNPTEASAEKKPAQEMAAVAT